MLAAFAAIYLLSAPAAFLAGVRYCKVTKSPHTIEVGVVCLCFPPLGSVLAIMIMQKEIR